MQKIQELKMLQTQKLVYMQVIFDFIGILEGLCAVI